MKNINGKTLYGADVLTIINNSIDNNEKNHIEKNVSGFYKENDLNSVKVELTLLSLNKDGETQEVIYQMESLENAGLDKFISSFGLITFECTDIKYNSQGRVSKILVKQMEI